MPKSNKNRTFYEFCLRFSKYDTKCAAYDTRVYYMISPSPRTSAVIPAQAGDLSKSCVSHANNPHVSQEKMPEMAKVTD